MKLTQADIFKYAAPLAIVVLAAMFIYNIIEHGRIPHPGKTTYTARCAECHGDNGEGIKVLVPPLAQSDFAKQNFDSIPCWLKSGINRPISVNGRVFDQPMYPLPLNEIQIANVMNYVSKEFLKSDKEVNSAWVKAQLKACK